MLTLINTEKPVVERAQRHVVQRQLAHLEHAERLLGHALKEAHSQHAQEHGYAARGGLVNEFEIQRLFNRLALFFDTFRKALKDIAGLAAAEGGELAALWQNLEQMLESEIGPLDGNLDAWGFHRLADGNWELNYLDLDFHLRFHQPELVRALERFQSGMLQEVLIRWCDRTALNGFKIAV
ncbi:MAG TPA: hypothetical protein V6D47_15570 [Oscillatoriaceae cyanobacterium]